VTIKKNILVTGPTRSRNSTLIKEVVQELRKRGFKVGGVSTPEIRVRGRRVGFKIVDIYTGREGILARVGLKGPRVSIYGVNIADIDNIGVEAIKEALDECEVVVIDEIAKMEFFSNRFKEILEEALSSEKPLIGTIQFRTSIADIERIKRREDVECILLTRANFNEVKNRVLNRVLGLLRFNA